MRKKLLAIALSLITVLFLSACTNEPTALSNFEQDEIEKIVVTLAMGNPDYGAQSKTITDKAEIEEFVQLFNNANLGDVVSDDDLGVGAISTYAFHDDEKVLKTFAFNVNDTNVVFWDSEARQVVYPQNAQTPFELYESSEAQEITVDINGDEMVKPPEESQVSSTAFLDSYIDTNNLTTFENIMSSEPYTFNDRTVLLESKVENDFTAIVFDYYFYSTSGEFDKISLGENTSFNNAISNEEKNFENGEFIDSYTVHNIEVLSFEEIFNISVLDKLNILIETFELTQTALVLADVSHTYNDKMQEKGPQIPEGRYERYYLLGKTESDTQFKIYEVFWGENISFQ